jgi:ABC-type transporter Mla subunit MlaD
MRRRSGLSGIASSPVLVGAVTILVLIVAVFLAYNANHGLPFVSTYNLNVEVPNADALVAGNDVRIGGALIGKVKSAVPVDLGDGRFAAKLSLTLDKSVEPIPVNSTVIIRPKSPLGLKYLQIIPGNSSKGFAGGETIPISAARPEPVDIDQFFGMFNTKTRTAIRQNEAGFGGALAGRGPQLNEAIGSLQRLLVSGEPALRNLVAPQTNFGGFWRALEDLSATVAPVAETNASLFVALDQTFAAFARVSRPYIQETISKSPSTLDTANADLPVLRPFLDQSQRFFTALKPGAKALADTSPTIAAALHAGVPVLNASPIFFAQLAPTAEALLDFQKAPGVFNGLDLLIDTNHTLGPAIKFIAPAQTTCNYLTLAFRNLASTTSEGNPLGNWLNFFAFELPEGPNAESGPSSAPANGPEEANHLHYNPYPNTAAPGQPKECEAGNIRYAAGQTVIGNVPGNHGTKTSEQLKGQGGSK